MHAAELLQSLLPTHSQGTVTAHTPPWRSSAPFRLVEVKGPDAADFLQRLCSQDVLGLREREVKAAAFLDAKGKLQATCLVCRIGDSLWLETQAEQVDKLAELLERYHFTEKLTIARRNSRCNEANGREREPPVREIKVLESQGAGFALRFDRRGISFVREHTFAPPAAEASAVKADGDLTPEAAECLRLLAGFVRVGVETEPATLALEADLDDHISTTKGCYTGQEIVARVHTYGHVNRKLCLLWLAAGERIEAPQPLHETEDQLAVGRVMHAVPVPGHEGRLGVGYLPKDFQTIGTRLTLADKTAVEVIGYEPLLPA